MSSGADEAIAAMDGKEFQGRSLRVNEARPREGRPPTRPAGAHFFLSVRR
jgi:RNA recognition motif-containing protein